MNEAAEQGPGSFRLRYAVQLVVVALAVATVAGSLALRRVPPVVESTVPVWLLAVGYAVTSVFDIKVPTRRDIHAVTLTEIPLVVGLFCVAPVGLVAASTVGVVAALFLPLRHQRLKLAFNVVQIAFATLVAILIFRAVLGEAHATDWRAWVAAALAAVAADALAAVLVTLVVWVHSGTFQRDTVLWVLVTGATASVGKGALALLAVVVLDRKAAHAVLLVALVTVVMHLAFRGYVYMYLRHQRVAKLYQFTRALSGSVEATQISERAAREARDLLRAQAAELALHGAVEHVVRYDGGGNLTVGTIRMADAPVIVALRDLHAVQIISRESASAPLEQWLARRGWDQALLAPLGTDANIGWLAVSRGAEDEPFGASDAHLFEALANHASVALENGRLLGELNAAALQREHRSLHDALTDLPNRVHLTDALSAAIGAARPDERVALLVVAVEDFGEIKETLGHEHGDEVALEVAARLRELSQGAWLAARLSEDEFAVLVPDAGSIGAAVRAADVVVRAFEEHPFSVAGLVLEVGVRVGVAVHPEHGSSAPLMLRRAEIALRAAKGKHARVGAFLPGDDPHTPKQLVVAHELRNAIDNGELAIYVQPKFDLSRGTVHAVEVLVRWVHDDQVRPPDEFIPVAERTGLIRPLTNFVLARALEHRRQWSAAGYDINIAVNVSVRDLVDPAFPEQVAVALTRAVCPSHALTLEITETQIMVEPDRVAAALRRLGVLGVGLSIDDFGTGYSSLSAVRALAVDEIKIDRSFVRHCAENMQDGTLVRSITELGHGLGLRVVAEGVEDEATLGLLRSMHVDAAQGYCIARPMPALELPGWLAEADQRALAEAPMPDAP